MPLQQQQLSEVFFFFKYYLFIRVSFEAGFPSVAQAYPKSAIWHSMGQTQSSPLASAS